VNNTGFWIPLPISGIFEAVMELSQEQKNFIGEYVRGHYQEWISPFTENRSISEREMEIRERIIRVEESLPGSCLLTVP